MAGKGKARSESAKVEVHGDWALRCPEATPCFLMQRVLLKGKEEQPLMNFILQFSSRPSRLLIAIRTPLGVVFAPGIELRVDRAKAGTYPYHHCRSEGCFAIFPVSGKLRRSLERGQRANVGYLLNNGKKYSIPVSLIGITAGLRALQNAAGTGK
ncbi:MAG: invasion associated locus B family protein [Candidatus Thiosymbion ectosymbiont of Robbea hypermnestra]|nr:invasion associated locus B family protein [Candidatus Thiosymbion ectosymbiont of Robbea hypermnestra]